MTTIEDELRVFKHKHLESDLAGCPIWLSERRCGCIPRLDEIAKRMEDHFAHLSIEQRQQMFLHWVLGDDVDVGP